MDYNDHFRAMNLRPIDFPLDRGRLSRAQSFASLIMTVVAPHCNDKISAYHALVASAYQADAKIVVEGQ